MSLFRKPKKIQRRVFCTEDDDDQAPATEGPQAPPPPLISPQPPPPPVISKKKDKPAKATSLLSFADEEEADIEEFKVKKSKQSSRLSKRRQKERRNDPDSPYNNHGNGEAMEVDNHIEKPKPKPKKKVTLEGLILTGREALAADGTGDISDSPEREDQEEEGADSHGFHTYRAESVRAALATAPGVIPDAALIHAARKTRQQARELGGDYIEVKPSEAPPGSRLVRDDGSDDDEGRIEVRGLDMPSDKPKRGTALPPPEEEELGSSPDEWEEQQVNKARMAAIPDNGDLIELNPFAVPLTAPQPPGPPQPAHLRVLGSGAPPSTVKELVCALRDRLHELQIERETMYTKMESVKQRILQCAETRAQRAQRTPQLDAAYRRAQAARSYLTDLIECLDEKMPELEALESRALALHKRRCQFIIARRRADLTDQAQDCINTGYSGRPNSRVPDSEDKLRRTAEREGRRRARRLAREGAGRGGHRDGDSSDDSLPPNELQLHRDEKESIRQQSSTLFADALPAWRSLPAVCARLARWRRCDPQLYSASYVQHCLPQFAAPYVRHQLILWNPLADDDNEDYERMDWYKCLMLYGVSSTREDSDADSDSEPEMAPPTVTEQSVRDDMDLMLVPSIIAKVVLPKVAELVENAWDPLSVRACIRLRQLIVRAALTPSSRAALDRLGRAAAATLSDALSADVYLPALAPQISEGVAGAFWRRCLGGGVRLLRATLALTGAQQLAADAHVTRLINTLCTAAGAAPPTFAASACMALAETLPRDGALRRVAMRRIAALAALALSRLHSDNPLHLKALEQTRAIIAESKALENDAA